MALELSRNVIIGQYLPGTTLVHRLDPRTKIFCTLVLLSAVSFTRSLTSAVIYLLAILLITRFSQIPLGFVLRPFLRGLPFILFFLTLSMLFLGWQEPAGTVFFQWGWLRITSNALALATLSLLRLVSLLMLIGLPTLTTRITELTHGTELLLLPFARFGVPAHDIALVMTIALRFVPILTEELERVIKAQASRGGEIGDLSWRRPLEIGQALLPLIVPLFVNSFRRAEELAVAMEARCFVRGARRTKYVEMQSTRVDALINAGVLFFTLVVWFLPGALSLP